MNANTDGHPKRRVLTVDISLGTLAEQVRTIAVWAKQGRSAYVCCVNAHMAMEGRDPSFAAVVNGADLATADGMPIVKSLRMLHGITQERVAGNDLMPALLAEAAREDIGVFLYGGTPRTQALIAGRVARDIPGARLVGMYAPPFKPLETLDPTREAERITATGAGLVMVSLGCPKQERWMALMKDRMPAVSIGLGGAFLLYAGLDTRAPKWMRDLSLEWLYRLTLEPGRLWKRYLVTNTLFLFYLLKALVIRLTQGKDP